MPTFSLHNPSSVQSSSQPTFSLAQSRPSAPSQPVPQQGGASNQDIIGPAFSLARNALGVGSTIAGDSLPKGLGSLGMGALNIGQAVMGDGSTGQRVAQGIQGGTQAYQGVSQLTNGTVPQIPGGPLLNSAMTLLGGGAAGGVPGLISAIPAAGAGLLGGIGAANAGNAAAGAMTLAGGSAAEATNAASMAGTEAMAGAGMGLQLLMNMGLNNVMDSILGAFQDVPHSVREAQGTQSANTLGQNMLQDMNLATTPQELWEAIQRYQLNTDPGIQLQGVNGLEGLLANPQAARLSTQAGVSPGGIAQANDQLTKMLQANATVIAAARAGNPEAIRFLEQRLQARPEFIRQAGEMVMPTPSHVIPPGGRGDAIDAGPLYDPARPSSIAEIMSPLIAGGMSLPQIQALMTAGNAVPMIPFGGLGDVNAGNGYARSDPSAQEYLIDPNRGGGF